MKSHSQLLAVLGTLLLSFPASAQDSCSEHPIALQVLGSGGPAGVGRASAAYLIWVDGKARVLIDAGGGTFKTFHEAGAAVEDLDLLAMTHFHPDHSAEIPALLWINETDMLLSGPTGSDMYPSADEYVNGLFGAKGVFRAVTAGKGLRTITIDTKARPATKVFANDMLRVTESACHTASFRPSATASISATLASRLAATRMAQIQSSPNLPLARTFWWCT